MEAVGYETENSGEKIQARDINFKVIMRPRVSIKEIRGIVPGILQCSEDRGIQQKKEKRNIQ